MESNFITPDRALLKDKMGRYLTQSLFRETAYGIKNATPIWTLKEVDPQGLLPSLRDIYIQCADPTEYAFAQLCFGSWRHFQHLTTLEWFSDYLQEYRDELEVALRSDALKLLIKQAEDPKGTTAAKFLANADWKGRSSKRGRPSKEEVQGERKRLAQIDDEIGNDAMRAGVTLLKDGTGG